MKVLLIHGVLMRPVVMALLAKRLREAGHEVSSFGYSMRPSFQEVTAGFTSRVNAFRPDAIVGHSMGGVIAIRSAQLFNTPVSKILCLGSPLNGSAIAKKIAGSWLRFVFSEASEDLTVRGLAGCKAADTTVGVLAGTKGSLGFNLLFRVLSGVHDGTVALGETKSPSADHHMELFEGHTSMLFSKKVADQVRYFLESGSFKT
jgi:pimeloyl-ACP methyl ester carboxylesterase